MRAIGWVVALALSLVAGASQAGEFYVGGFGGFGAAASNEFGDDYKRDIAVFGRNNVVFDGRDYVAGGSLGYAFQLPIPARFRLEFEASHRENRDDGNRSGGLAFLRADMGATSVMLNPLLDYDPFDGLLVPYLGVGVGAAFVEANYHALGQDALASESIVDEHSAAFAWQAIGGVSTNLIPYIDLFAEARYFDVPVIDARVRRLELGLPVASPHTNLQYTRFDVIVGIRVPFGRAEPKWRQKLREVEWSAGLPPAPKSTSDCGWYGFGAGVIGGAIGAAPDGSSDGDRVAIAFGVTALVTGLAYGYCWLYPEVLTAGEPAATAAGNQRDGSEILVAWEDRPVRRAAPTRSGVEVHGMRSLDTRKGERP